MARDGVAVTVQGQARAPVERTFATIAPIDLATIFRGFGPLPAVVATREQTGDWDHVGASRVVELADGSEAGERLTAYDAPGHFAYRLGPFTGPLRRLVDHADGAWWFTAAGDGTTGVRWTYVFRPRSPAHRAGRAPRHRPPLAGLRAAHPRPRDPPRGRRAGGGAAEPQRSRRPGLSGPATRLLGRWSGSTVTPGGDWSVVTIRHSARRGSAPGTHVRKRSGPWRQVSARSTLPRYSARARGRDVVAHGLRLRLEVVLLGHERRAMGEPERQQGDREQCEQHRAGLVVGDDLGRPRAALAQPVAGQRREHGDGDEVEEDRQQERADGAGAALAGDRQHLQEHRVERDGDRERGPQHRPAQAPAQPAAPDGLRCSCDGIEAQGRRPSECRAAARRVPSPPRRERARNRRSRGPGAGTADLGRAIPAGGPRPRGTERHMATNAAAAEGADEPVPPTPPTRPSTSRSTIASRSCAPCSSCGASRSAR